MKKNLLGLAIAGTLVAAIATPASAAGPTAADLINDTKATADVTTYGMGYGQQRFSKLNQITRANVKKLAPVWSQTAPRPRHHFQPDFSPETRGDSGRVKKHADKMGDTAHASVDADA